QGELEVAERKDKAFFVCFLTSASIVAGLSYFTWPQRLVERWWPWLHGVMGKEAGVGFIAALILWLDLWVFFFLLVRWARTQREKTLLSYASSQIEHLGSPPDLHEHLGVRLKEPWRALYDDSQLKVRLELMRAR